MTPSIGRTTNVTEPAPLVLMYHSVAPIVDDPYLVTVSPPRFERQLRWLRARGLRGTSVGELLDARRAGRARGLVGLTFDDGYADFGTRVLPALRRFGFTATAFVLAGRLGGHNAWDEPGPRKELMTADEVRRAADDGVEIGSHGLRHLHLPAVDDDALADEIGSSRTILEQLTGRPVRGFCYPYGEVDDRVAAMVGSAGYDYGCAIRPGPAAGRHTLPRTYVGEADGALRLWAKRARHRLTAPRLAPPGPDGRNPDTPEPAAYRPDVDRPDGYRDSSR